MTASVVDRPEREAATIRAAKSNDLPAITRIYGYYVRETAVSFEIEPPTASEMAQRWRSLTADGYSYLVATSGGAVCGFAFTGPYKPRAAYRGTVEESIYLAPEACGRGIGTALMEALIKTSENKGYHQMIARIASHAGGRTAASLALHRKLGFREVGRLKEIGRKFGRLIDVVIMQRALGGGE